MAGPGDLYEVLGVKREATADQIRDSYRRLALKYHPDKNPGDRQAEERFKRLAEAYAVLSDPEKRAVYDRGGHRVPFGRGPGGPGGGPGAGYDFSDFGVPSGGFSVEEILERFGDLFGGFDTPFTGGRVARRRGGDATASIEIPFRTAALGGQISLTLAQEEPCGECGGSGIVPGRRPCPTCGGRRTIRRDRGLTVTIPEGTTDGATLRLRGMGAPGAGGASAGDLMLQVGVTEDTEFRREGNDVQSDVTVPAPVAVLGGKVSVATLRGTAEVTVPPGTSSGALLRLRGQGIKGGDHLARVQVSVPSSPSPEQRELYERLQSLE